MNEWVMPAICSECGQITYVPGQSKRDLPYAREFMLPRRCPHCGSGVGTFTCGHAVEVIASPQTEDKT